MLPVRLIILVSIACSLFSTGRSANSNGQIGDAKLDRIHSAATRFYYHNTDSSVTYSESAKNENGQSYTATVYGKQSESVSTNALGDNQVLFYEYYSPLTVNSANNKACAIYFHGGGYTVGYANQGYESSNIKFLREQGFHAISVEYRRGWFRDGSSGPAGGEDITPAEGTKFLAAVDYALVDAMEAWTHINSNSAGHARQFSNTWGGLKFTQGAYLVLGTSAGGSIASRLVLTHPIPSPRGVIGAIVGFGTHAHDESVVNFNIPTYIQGGLFDDISPAYTNYIYFDSDAVLAKGIFELYDELKTGNADVRLLMCAQKGHGYGCYKDSTDESAVYVGEALTFFKDAYNGNNPVGYQEMRFSQKAKYTTQQGAAITIDDSGNLYEQIGTGGNLKKYVVDFDLGDSNKLYVNGFTYDSSVTVASGFEFVPVQTDLKNGMSPNAVGAKYNLPGYSAHRITNGAPAATAPQADVFIVLIAAGACVVLLLVIVVGLICRRRKQTAELDVINVSNEVAQVF